MKMQRWRISLAGLVLAGYWMWWVLLSSFNSCPVTTAFVKDVSGSFWEHQPLAGWAAWQIVDKGLLKGDRALVASFGRETQLQFDDEVTGRNRARLRDLVRTTGWAEGYGTDPWTALRAVLWRVRHERHPVYVIMLSDWFPDLAPPGTIVAPFTDMEAQIAGIYLLGYESGQDVLGELGRLGVPFMAASAEQIPSMTRTLVAELSGRRRRPEATPGLLGTLVVLMALGWMWLRGGHREGRNVRWPAQLVLRITHDGNREQHFREVTRERIITLGTDGTAEIQLPGTYRQELRLEVRADGSLWAENVGCTVSPLIDGIGMLKSGQAAELDEGQQLVLRPEETGIQAVLSSGGDSDGRVDHGPPGE